MPPSYTATKPIPISGSGSASASVGSRSVGSRTVSLNNGGYFTRKHVNTRPEWVKSYNLYSRLLGKEEANATFSGIKNWISAEKLAGRSGNTTGKTRKTRKTISRKTRKNRRNLKRK
jgi:hypothetical protein